MPEPGGVFLSYAREDRERAGTFARALAESGRRVWWDRNLLPGQVFDAEITRQLAEARCVVVLWSARSIHKRWVRDEAEEGAARDVLVPVLIDDVQIPLGFRRFQTERLVEWDGQGDHPSFLRLLAAVDGRLRAGPAPAVSSRQTTRIRKRLSPLALAIGPTVIALALSWVLVNWELGTPFDLQAMVSRVAYTVDAREGPVQILASLPVRSVVVEKFSSFEIEPAHTELAEAALYDIATDSFPEHAWRRLATTAPVLRFTPASPDRIAKVSVSALRSSAPAAVLDAIRVAPRMTVTAEVSQHGHGLTIWLRGDAPRALLLWDAPIEVVADHVLLDPIAAPGKSDSRSYRFHPKDASPVASFIGRQSELVLNLRPPVPSRGALQVGSAIGVASVDFTTLDGTGRRVSSIAGPTLLRFPASSRLLERHLGTADPLQIGELQRAVLKQVQYNPSRGLLVVQLAGEAGQVRVGAGGVPIDVQSNALSRLRDEWPLLRVLLLGIWLTTTALGLAWLVRRTAMKYLRRGAEASS